MAEEMLGLVVMGPSACGKSEVSAALAAHYGCQWIDADALHSETNIEKMRNGIPLTDEDRFPWLCVVRERFVTVFKSDMTSGNNAEKCKKVGAVVACSALKKVYRDILSGTHSTQAHSTMATRSDGFKTVFVYLDCSEETLQNRISQRQGHFMKANMLQSQLKTLERPTPEEDAVIVNGSECIDSIVIEATQKLSNQFG